MKIGISSKILIVVVASIIALGVFLGVYFIRHEHATFLMEFDERAQVLVHSLSSTSEYPVLTGNKELLAKSAQSILQQKDVAYCRIETAKGNVLFEGGAMQINEGKEYIAAIITFKSDENEEDLLLGRQEGVKEIVGRVILQMSLNNVYRKVNEMMRVIILFVLSGVFVAVIFLTVLIHVILNRPVRELIVATKRISDGDLKYKVKIRYEDELGLLAKAFNAMTDNLEKVTASRDELNIEISERQKAEESLKKAYADLQSAQAQLIQSEKMASLGMLSAGVAHEINNPLGFVMSNLGVLSTYATAYQQMFESAENVMRLLRTETKELVLKQVDEYYQRAHERRLESIITDIEPLLSETKGGLERIRKIVLDLKTFAHADSSILTEVNVNQIIDSAISICWNELKYKVELIKEYGQILLINGSEQKIEQVFINLLVNAAQSIEGNGMIRISTSVRDGMICVQVIDSGKGIPQENIGKIFDPFFTTKPVGKGTGLGLSVSYDIVKQHGGYILVKSELGIGTTFTVLLPVSGIPGAVDNA